jgi:ankyrin repeat protein
MQFAYRDNWGRSPVHWAVLNGQIAVLDVLLQSGYFCANPQPLLNNDRKRRTSEESPIEICHRLYHHSNPELYQRIQCLLLQYMDN